MEVPVIGLRGLAGERLLVGAAVSAGVCDDPRLQRIITKDFSVLTTENALKMEVVAPESGRYEWGDADAIVAFAERHDQSVRGHTLVWHQQLPSWVLRSAEHERDEILRAHITATVGRYRGRIKYWDVVNEAIDDNGSFRQTPWSGSAPIETFQKAFQWAHDTDPSGLLFYNDYGAEALGMKSDAVYALLKNLRERQVPVHGVGLQMHLDGMSPISLEDVRTNIRRLATLGLIIHITELDVRMPVPLTPQAKSKQAAVYRRVVELVLSEPAVQALVVWGIHDGASWIPSQFPGHGGALLYDAQCRPKPSYTAVLEALRGNHV